MRSALATVVLAVGCLVPTAVGCTSASENTASGAGAETDEDASAGDMVPPPGSDDAAAVDPDAGDRSCLDQTPIDATQYPYKKAGVTANACTSAELDQISTYFKTKTDANEDVSIAAWAATVSPGCAACVFSDGSGATWTPILTKDDRLDEVNRGGCIELKSGKESCGRAYQQISDCRLDACLTQCRTQDEFDACLQDPGIFSGPCRNAFTTLTNECGNDLGAYENACAGATWTFDGPMRAQCLAGN